MSSINPLKSLAKRAVRAVRRKIMPDARTSLLRRMPKGAVCCEIGVWEGSFSVRILEVTEPAELHLIDPWQFQPEFPDRMYGGKVAKQQQDMDRIFEQVSGRLGRLPQVTIHRAKSSEALARFQDGFFDWIYIDGNHYYEHVLADLELSFAKVRVGGFITGDDYDWGGPDLPVTRAVSDFMEHKGIAPPRLELLDDQFIIRR